MRDNFSEPEILHLYHRDNHMYLPKSLGELEKIDVGCVEYLRPSANDS